MDEQKTEDIQVIEDLDENVAAEEAPNFQLATVGAVTADGIKLIFDGTDEASDKEYKANSGVKFTAGDRVKITKDSGTYIVEYVVGAPGGTYPVPTGGSNGQVLTKDGANDYAVKWASVPHELPTGGTDGQVLTKDGANNYAVKWADSPHGLPSGGSSGQVLAKSSATDYAVSWTTIHQVPSGGTSGQVLAKSSATDYALTWSTVKSIPSGGTSGQVLAKSSATDYAVSWTTINQVPSSGTTGHVLTKTASGYEWAAASAGSVSKLINGSYQLQLGSSGVLTGASTTYNVQLGSNTIPINGCYLNGAMRIGTGSTAGTTLGFFGTTPAARQTVSNSATVATLITALKKYGLIA